MIFNCLDFDISSKRGEEPARLHRALRLRINHIVESFTLRIPKKIRTELFQKLNVCARNETWFLKGRGPFFVDEGIAEVEIVVPDIASIYRETPTLATKRIKALLRRGIRIAAKNDRLFAKHMDLWMQLLSTVDEEFDYDLRMSRSHRSRRWRCNAVIRLAPTAYHYDVLVVDSRSLDITQRWRFKTTKCSLPYFGGIGFSKLRWDGAEVVGLTRNNKEVFRFRANLPA